MSRIRKLPEHIVRRIAAGEVIERPASVLKELLENALDAGARRITVEWDRAGRKNIRVTDDGHGMTPDEARLALERHATSKITSFEDLEKVLTFGFRGEALPSIAAVSRFQLVTRPVNAKEGWSIECEGGKVLREGPAGAPPGTTISVEDLFFNTPAREKFLRSETTERGFLLRCVEDVALAARRSDFQVFAEKKEILGLRATDSAVTPEESLHLRLKDSWGLDRLGAAKAVRQTGRFLTVYGWISDVHSPQSTARYQRFFLNNRPIVSRRLSHALYEAYRGSLLVGKHPLAVLFLEMNPTLVDVNVHPTKREVRISHEEEVYGFLLQALRNSLAGYAEMPSALSGLGGHETPPEQNAPTFRSQDFDGTAGTGSRLRVSLSESVAALAAQAPAHLAGQIGRDGASQPSAEMAIVPDSMSTQLLKEGNPEVLLQLDGTYILARVNSALLVFDQHAAAERVLYERLSEAAQGVEPGRQVLLLPWVWELSSPLANVVNEHLEHFRRLGYELEPFGAQAFRVKAVPGILGDSPKVRSVLEGLADDLATGIIPRTWDALLIRAACRGSVKAHDPLKHPEMEKLIKELQKCKMPWCCPHGRPTFLRLSADELAKRFQRT